MKEFFTIFIIFCAIVNCKAQKLTLEILKQDSDYVNYRIQSNKIQSGMQSKRFGFPQGFNVAKYSHIRDSVQLAKALVNEGFMGDIGEFISILTKEITYMRNLFQRYPALLTTDEGKRIFMQLMTSY